MFDFQNMILNYLEYCGYQKNLSAKTIKAYNIDLKQFANYMENTDMELNRVNVSNYITFLHKKYKPKTVKRKIASVKVFFSYLEYEDILHENPFVRLKIKYKEPILLPRTISLQSLEKIFKIVYDMFENDNLTEYKKNTILRDIAVLELLFAAGLRVSELCSLKSEDVDLIQGTIRIYGKGSKERIVMITNEDVLKAIENYIKRFDSQIKSEKFLFINRLKKRLSEQSVRFMVYRYANIANITEHITPHMFRHTFATMLLEEDVDIRYIQQILGHSSIITTQIYTHVTSNKQRDILTTKHPRNKLIV